MDFVKLSSHRATGSGQLFRGAGRQEEGRAEKGGPGPAKAGGKIGRALSLTKSTSAHIVQAHFAQCELIEEDLLRRDTTMNSMALRLPEKTLIDPYGRQADIERRTIRATSKHLALAANLTNEGCFDGRYRILKNTTGLWIIQELQRDWRLQGQDISFAEMVTLARNVTNNRSWINPNDAIFAAPGDMEAKVRSESTV